MSGQQPPPFQTFIQEGPGWEGIGNKLQYANDYLQVYLATVRTPSRPAGALWTVVHRKAAAVVAPMRADGRLVLIRQERIPVRAALWEFPAGQIDSPEQRDDAAIRATACRELREEAGYELGPGGELIAMGCFFSSPGFTDEHAYLFLARGVIPAAGGAEHDENEAIEGCRAFTVEELRRMIAENEVRDANTLSAFARLTALGLI
jgi:ADP-ribose pyrophosphatase